MNFKDRQVRDQKVAKFRETHTAEQTARKFKISPMHIYRILKSLNQEEEKPKSNE